MNAYTIKNIKDFDPKHTFDCGQCFRWYECADGSYDGVIGSHIVNIRFNVKPPLFIRGDVAERQGDRAIPQSAMPTAPFAQGSQSKPPLFIRGDVAKRQGGSEGISEATTGDLTITTLSPLTEQELTHIKAYLDLDRDYSEIKSKLATSDKIIQKAIQKGQGIRILKQDFFEALISFIISQNNNIPRIQGCIERLCNEFGEEIKEAPLGRECFTEVERLSPCTFPTVERLAELKVDDLANIRLGYRAEYIIETSKEIIRRGGLEVVQNEIAKCDKSDDLVAYLKEFKGVGPKVANCVALFGCQRLEAFPIDVWVKRVMNRLYGIAESDTQEMAEYAKAHFDEYGGIAQQYLFYYMRE